MNSTDNTLIKILRPAANESAPYYHGYIDQVKYDDAMEGLEVQYFTAIEFFKSIPEEKWDYRYQDGKWTIKEVILHVIDAERIFAYRALRIARNDATPLPGFDQDIYVPESNAENRSANSIIEEYKTVREATHSLFINMSNEAISRIGTASDNPISPRALAWILLGHEQHHISVIKERYFI